jgi:RNA polymerase subunit RPABC4/transcription elongation factor Spt4
MLQSFRDRTRQFQQRLTRLDDQPLSKAALVVIIFLDLFILGSIFDGLADHTRQLDTPDEVVPQLCRDIVIDADWNPTNRLGHLAQMVTSYQSQRYTPFEHGGEVRQHPVCAPITRAYQAVRDDAGLAKNLRESVRLRREVSDLRARLERTQGAYDTRLLENIAGQRGQADVGAIRQENAARTATLDELVGREQQLAAALEQDPKVRELFARVANVSEADRTALRDELRRLNFWHPVKRLGMEMLFLLPLLAVFWFWNSRSIAGSRPFQTLVSSHLLVVACIPVFFKVAELVYDIIPRRLLQQFIELLESLKLVALWHYLVIGLAILAALALIHLFQKKLFSQERLLQRRIARGQCQACGQHLPPDSRHCPACGAAQYRVCSQCQALTHLHGRHCRACGAANPGE